MKDDDHSDIYTEICQYGFNQEPGELQTSPWTPSNDHIFLLFQVQIVLTSYKSYNGFSGCLEVNIPIRVK